MNPSSNFIKANQIYLWVETFGKVENPAILLICGAGAISEFWPQDFCQRLTASGYFVIRYDQRDYGHSTHFPQVSLEELKNGHKDKLPYTIDALVNDALGILDHFQIKKAHVIGHSMGGHIAQLMAINHPERVASAVVISSNPGPKPGLSPIPPKTGVVLFSNQPQGEFEDDLAGWLKSWRYFNGTAPFDEELAVAYTKAIYQHQPGPSVAYNHIAAVNTVPDLTPGLATMKTPLLVIHGEEDYLDPLDHGQAIATAAPHSRLIILPEAGHVFFNKELWQNIGSAILEFLAPAITFQPCTTADVPLYMAWAELPHVKNTWFQDGYEPKESIFEKIQGNGYDYPYIILVEDKPIGYIQCSDLRAYYRAHPEAKIAYYAKEPLGTYCIDLFIGEPAYLHKGYGTKIVRQFSDWLLAKPEVSKIVIDPAVDNRQAIRCYEKAGFKYVRLATDHVEMHYIMEKTM